MEPISLTAGVIAIITFTTKLAASIRDLQNCLKAASAEIDDLNNEVQNFLVTLLRVRDLIDNLADLNHAFTTSISCANRENLRAILSSSSQTIQLVQDNISTFRSLYNRKRSDKFKLLSRNSDNMRGLRDLRDKLERDKTSMLMALQLNNLETAALASKKTCQTEKLVAALLGQVAELKAQQTEFLNSQKGFSNSSEGAFSHQRSIAHDQIPDYNPHSYGYSLYESTLAAPRSSQAALPTDRVSFKEEEVPPTSLLDPRLETEQPNVPDQVLNGRSGQNQLENYEELTQRHSADKQKRPNVIETHSSIGAWMSSFS